MSVRLVGRNFYFYQTLAHAMCIICSNKYYTIFYLEKIIQGLDITKRWSNRALRYLKVKFCSIEETKKKA